MLQKNKTERDKKYLVWLRSQPCIRCSNPYTEAHHTSSGGMGIKGSDYDAIPLCHNCHMAVHQKYGKQGFWTPEQLKVIIAKLLDKYKGLL